MADPRRITLEIEADGPPIHGRLLTGADGARAFTGWMSLLAALDAAISHAVPISDTESGAATPRSLNP